MKKKYKLPYCPNGHFGCHVYECWKEEYGDDFGSAIDCAIDSAKESEKNKMNEWILILAMWAGALAKGDSVSVTSVHNFRSEEACKIAGKVSVKEFTTPFKTVKFICVKNS